MVFTAITNIHYQQETAMVPVPEEDPEKEEQDPALEKEIEDALAQNEEIKIKNDQLTKIKGYVRLIVPEETEEAVDPEDFKDWDEKGYLRVMNYREMVMNESGEMVDAAAHAAALASAAKAAENQTASVDK